MSRVQDLTTPVHLGLIYWPFVPRVQSREPRSITEAPHGPQAYTLNILRLQKRRSPDVHVWVRPKEYGLQSNSKWRVFSTAESLTSANVERRILLNYGIMPDAIRTSSFVYDCLRLTVYTCVVAVKIMWGVFSHEENLAAVSSDRNNAVCRFWFNVSWTEISRKIWSSVQNQIRNDTSQIKVPNRCN
jgi:hypothetical protein